MKIGTKTALKETFLEYCSSSSVHGVKYIGIRKRFDRLGWILLVLGFLVICFINFIPILEKWRRNPIELAFERKFVPINEITFPAITVCRLQMPNKKLYNYYDALRNGARSGFNSSDRETLKLFKLLTQTFFYLMRKNTSEIYRAAKQFPEIKIDIEEENQFLTHFLLPSQFVLYMCRGIKRADYWNCDVEFHRHYLDMGFCYTFNMSPKAKIFRTNVTYPLAQDPNFIPPNVTFFNEINLKKRKKPFRIFDRRQEFEFETHFYQEFEDPICKPDFHLYIHAPTEIPWEGSNRFTMPFNQRINQLFIQIEPQVINSDFNLKKFEVNDRDCYFTDERPLKYFLEYSKANCEYECYVNETQRKFNCSPDFMPHYKSDRICNLTEILLLSDIPSFEQDRNMKCGCLNDCNTIKYDIGVSQIHSSSKFVPRTSEEELIKAIQANVSSDFHKEILDELGEKLYLMKIPANQIPVNITSEGIRLKVLSNIDAFMPEFNILSWNSSRLHIFYAKSLFLPMRRYTPYNFADIVAQCGGIFGGIMGISLLSFCEIVYFCTIRLLEKRKLTPIDVIQDELKERR
uniref:CSON006445 protein n=1 Tax=Culicoides sonorensis TaxID=179676 RepID=A0A336LW45_CULSO